ncbi:DUF3592 domain-containing protein [Kitasatospora sp. NPDC056184]|uniref:DUF3592 domain-containing protein n=1 Tax=Kitasatospora sp. NPDC056184 TaxID=3345738 RepID=UPI0035D5CF33
MNLLALTIGTVLGGSSYYTGSRSVRTFRIRRYGQRLRARVTEVDSRPVGDEGGVQDDVKVRFELPDGAVVEAATSISLRGPTGLEPGDLVEIAYHRSHPRNVVVLGHPSADGVGLLGYACVLFAATTVFFYWIGLTLD